MRARVVTTRAHMRVSTTYVREDFMAFAQEGGGEGEGRGGSTTEAARRKEMRERGRENKGAERGRGEVYPQKSIT